MKKIGLSVIIPIYNSGEWIRPTLEHLDAALKKSQFDAEVIVVDDGSSDDGAQVAKSTKLDSGASLHVIEQPNKGRYLARKTGVDASTKENILFVDSRVFTGVHALSFLYSKLINDSDQIWNGHVHIDKAGSPYTRFWDAIVAIAWRKYFRHPAETSYSIKEFDYYPKGTGFFYVPKKRLVAAMQHFEKTTNDIEHSSDDTLLIRFMNERQKIHLSPEFDCLYHGRTNAKSFFKHAYHRGEFFIDGFLRPGTRFFVPLILVLALSICAVVSILLWPTPSLLVFLGLLILFPATLLAGALLFGVEAADAAALTLLAVPFAFVYLLGLWRGVIRKFI